MAGVVPDPLLERHLADLAARQPFRDFTYWIERPFGRRCCAVSGVPRFAPDGRFLGYRGTGTDITEHKLAERALHDSEQRLRTVMETAVDGIITIDANGTIDYVNPAVERLFGYFRSELIGGNVKALMPGPDRERHDTYIAQYLTTGQPKVIGIGRDVTGRRKDGSTFPIYLSVGEFQIDGARYFAGILRDITERKQAEDQLKLLLRELEHRVKNILAVVRAIAFQTARQSNTLERFTESFSARVDALASAHDLLIQGQWRSARMSQVVERGLSLYRQPDGRNVETVGEDLAVTPRTAIAFSLILYELATNAAKYGAFSVSGGRVRLEWRVAEDDFALSWSESRGPRVRAPERRGFGSALIGGITEHELGGKAELRFDPKGLRCRIVVPRREVLAPPHAPVP